MAIPVFQAAGSAVASLSSITVVWPSHQLGDLALLVIEGGGYPVLNDPLYGNWTHVATSPRGYNGANGNGAVELAVMWKRAESSSEPNVIILGAIGGGQQIARILTFRGVLPVGSPLNGSASIENAANTAIHAMPSFSTTIAGCLVVGVTSNCADSNTPQGTVGSNASLISPVEIADSNTDLGFGGGFTVGAGGKLATGSTGAWNFTVLAASNAYSFVLALIPAIRDSSFNAAGLSTANMISAALKESSFESDSIAVVSNPGNINRLSAFSSAGIASASNPGGYKFASTFASAGVATAEMEGASLVKSSFNAAGIATAIMVGAGNNASAFSSSGLSSANMIGNSTAESGFSSEGTSLAVMFSPSVVASAFNSTGTSTAAMFAPTITVTTLVDGSGGAGLATVIDYSLCDFAQVILSAGVGTYSIEHVNLIAGKWITVTLVNQGASGSLIWNNGDAPVDWSPALAPDFPANGETLDLEFFVRRDRSVIRGRRAFA